MKDSTTDYFGPPLRDGDLVDAVFKSTHKKVRGRIAVVGDRIYICQDYNNGLTLDAKYKHGYRFSHVINDPRSFEITLWKHDIERITHVCNDTYSIF
jgi:hypothetical protein